MSFLLKSLSAASAFEIDAENTSSEATLKELRSWGFLPKDGSDAFITNQVLMVKEYSLAASANAVLDLYDLSGVDWVGTGTARDNLGRTWASDGLFMFAVRNHGNITDLSTPYTPWTASGAPTMPTEGILRVDFDTPANNFTSFGSVTHFDLHGGMVMEMKDFQVGWLVSSTNRNVQFTNQDGTNAIKFDLIVLTRNDD